MTGNIKGTKITLNLVYLEFLGGTDLLSSEEFSPSLKGTASLCHEVFEIVKPMGTYLVTVDPHLVKEKGPLLRVHLSLPLESQKPLLRCISPEK